MVSRLVRGLFAAYVRRELTLSECLNESMTCLNESITCLRLDTTKSIHLLLSQHSYRNQVEEDAYSRGGGGEGGSYSKGRLSKGSR